MEGGSQKWWIMVDGEGEDVLWPVKILMLMMIKGDLGCWWRQQVINWNESGSCSLPRYARSPSRKWKRGNLEEKQAGNHPITRCAWEGQRNISCWSNNSARWRQLSWYFQFTNGSIGRWPSRTSHDSSYIPIPHPRKNQVNNPIATWDLPRLGLAVLDPWPWERWWSHHTCWPRRSCQNSPPPGGYSLEAAAPRGCCCWCATLVPSIRSRDHQQPLSAMWLYVLLLLIFIIYIYIYTATIYLHRYCY